METTQSINLTDVADQWWVCGLVELLFLEVAYLVDFVMLELEESQKVFGNGLEVALRGGEQIIGHGVVG